MKRNPKKFGPRLTVSLTGKDYDTLNALAEKDDVSLSWVVRRAVDEYLRKRRRGIDPALSARSPKRGSTPAAGQLQNR